MKKPIEASIKDDDEPIEDPVEAIGIDDKQRLSGQIAHTFSFR